MVMRYITLSFFAILLCFSHSQAQADVRVDVSSQNISLNDTLEMTFIYKGDQNNMPSDLPNRDKIDQWFDIINVQNNHSTSMQITSINGQRQTITEITYTLLYILAPKKAGTFEMPATQWGQFKTQPLRITISDKPNSESDFFIESTISTQSPYVQELMTLTVKAYSTKRLRYVGLGFTPPNDVIAKHTGQKDKIYNEERYGRTYFVQERKYIVYAQRSGEITIPPITFTGELLKLNTFARSERRMSRSTPIKLNVIPDPTSNSQAPWLPAKSVTLSQYLPEKEYESGEPITLTLSMSVEGALSSQLPEFNLSKLNKYFKAYPDKPKFTDKWSNNTVIATRTEQVTLIPTQSGEITLPEITLDWWDTKEKMLKTARTKSIKMNIKRGEYKDSGSSEVGSGNLNNSHNRLSDSTHTVTGTRAKEPSEYAQNRVSKLWFYSTLILTALLSMALLWIVKLKRIQATKPTSPTPLMPSISTQDLIKQLRDKNPKQANKLLIMWARSNLDPSINNLHGITQHGVSPELAKALMQLNQHLYAGLDTSSWSSNALKSALKAFIPEMGDAKPKSRGFYSLYPNDSSKD